MSVKAAVEPRSGYKAPVVLVVSILVMSIALTWTFFADRALMQIGGACADGGPYVVAQPCPDGVVLMAFAIPAMLITAMVGTGAAIGLRAPNLLIPMWAFLFGSLGWNFLEFAFAGADIVWGWLICGVVFELMALPAILGVLTGIRDAVIPPRRPRAGDGSRWWVPAYALLGSVGFTFGWWSFLALR